MAFAVMGSTPCVNAMDVGMVLSTTGKVKVIDNHGKKRAVLPMLILEEGNTLVTGENESVQLVLFKNSFEYTVGANSRVRVMVEKVEKESGEVKVARHKDQLELPSNYGLSSRKLMGKMIRDLQAEKSNFLNPSNFAQVRNGSISFSWQLVEPAESVIFTLFDPEDEVILKTEVKGNTLTIPVEGKALLNSGKSYFAEVYNPSAPASSAAGRTQTEFRVMDPEEVIEVETCERQAAELMKQSPDDPSPLMKLMILYLHHKLYSDALITGERLQVMLPDNPALLRMKAQSLVAMGLTDRAREVEAQAVKLETNR
jgi:hypothetical protein